ncbi:MAG: ABC transporter ATP-binding protein [Deltaproteobacteria bacterium]|nr:ABC transporter ATP-binding protein [Deltaproteobacteria bacterium]
MIEIRNVYKWFITRTSDILALEDVSLTVGEGDFVAFVGPSGCGKSTLLNMIAGLMEPTSGSILYRGKESKGVNTDMGYITQHDSLFPWRNVEQNVGISLEIQRIPWDERSKRIQKYINLVGLQGCEKHYPSQLSGGMRKRVALARTLIYDPVALLLDEPFGALDAQLKLILQDELLKIWDRTRKTMIFVTHDLGEAIALADRLVVFTGRPGRIKLIRDIPIERPRDVFQIRFAPLFGQLYEEIWESLRGEVSKGEDL